jgi:hypothetical protein
MCWGFPQNHFISISSSQSESQASLFTLIRPITIHRPELRFQISHVPTAAYSVIASMSAVSPSVCMPCPLAIRATRDLSKKPTGS